MATQYSTNAGLEYWQLGDRNWHTQYATTCQRLDGLAAIGPLGVRATDPGASAMLPSTSLKVNVAAGSFKASGGSVVSYAGTSSLTLSASTTTYLWLTAAGVLATGAAYPTGIDIVRLAHVTTDGSHVTAIVDDRLAWETSGGTAGNAGVLYTATADAAAVANTTTATTCVGTGVGSLTVAAGVLSAGRVLRVRGWGVVSSTGSPTLTLSLRIGSGSLATAAVTLAGVSGQAIAFEVLAIVRAGGGSGSAYAVASVQTGTSAIAPNASNASFDNSVSTALDVKAQWSAADPANTFTCKGLVAEILG